MVKIFIDKVHRAAGDFNAVFEGLGLPVESGKGRQQRWMNIENAMRKGGDEERRKQAHVAGQADQIDFVLMQAGDHVGVVLGALAAFGNEELRRQP
jgi:hypothetical protein